MADFTILSFVEHLAALTVGLDHAEHESLERAARIVQAEAQGSVGTYQGASGPFVAWAPLAASTQDDRVNKGFPADEPELRTGGLRDSIEYTIHPAVFQQNREAEVGSNDPVMEYQELGTSRMPPRSILGGAAARRADDVAHEIGETYVSALMVAEGGSRLSSVIAGRPIRLGPSGFSMTPIRR